MVAGQSEAAGEKSGRRSSNDGVRVSEMRRTKWDGQS